MTKKVVSPPAAAAVIEPAAAPMPLLAYEIPVQLIDPNPEQPRVVFDEEGLKGLAQSIKENGVIEPIVVEQLEERFILHDGERRLRATKMAGLATIPAYVAIPPADDVARRARLVRALVANVQRTDLNPIEEARAYARMHDELGMTDQQIADQVGGKSRSYVTNKRRLLELPDDLKDKVVFGKLSERQAMALLPLVQLPPSLLKAAEGGYGWASPTRLLKEANTLSSDDIRTRIQNMIDRHTVLMGKLPFRAHLFDIADGIQAPCCDACEARLKVGDELRCQDIECHGIKMNTWRALRLAEASAASGFPLAEGEISYSTVEHFYSDGRLLPEILKKGCPNLRLYYAPDGGPAIPHPQGFADVALLCQHGKGKHCTCLSKAKGESTRNDPERIAEREREKEIAALLHQATLAVQAALAAGNVGVWRQLVRRYVEFKEEKKADEWTLEEIQARTAKGLVDANLTWNARHNSVEVARNEIKHFFDKMGVALPGQDPLGDVRRRLARIQGWIEGLDDQAPTLDQVRGNQDNLQAIAADIDLDTLDEAARKDADDLLRDLERVSTILFDLYRLMLNSWFDTTGFDSISWLLHTPVGDVNFENRLKEASPSLISYTLALLPEEDNVNKRKVLESRLRALSKNGHEPVSVQTPVEEVANA